MFYVNIILRFNIFCFYFYKTMTDFFYLSQNVVFVRYDFILTLQFLFTFVQFYGFLVVYKNISRDFFFYTLDISKDVSANIIFERL